MAYSPPGFPHLPNVIWSKPTTPDTGTGLPSRADVNGVATSPSDQQAQLAAENAPLRVIYGRARVGAQMADALVYQGKLVVVAVWGHGEIDAIEQVWMGDAALPSGVTATHYTGTSGQTANSTLIAAYAAQGITYADALPGVAYSVIVVPAGASEGFPTFTALIRGLKVYDPRSDSTAWSDNPALCLADYIAAEDYGWGRAVDQSSVETSADACDATVGGSARRKIGLAIEQTSECRQHVEALRAYAGCWISQGEAGVRLIPDRPAASVMSLGAGDIVAGSLKLSKRSNRQTPTVVDVRWTDTSRVPWSEQSAVAKLAGVDAGTTPRRESQISLPGIHRYAQAYREALERLNHLTLEDLEASWEMFDEGLALEVGDVVSVTHPVGLSAKLMRITGIDSTSPGRYRVSAREYDPAAYSDAAPTAPTYSDTDLPNPAAPPAVTGLTLTEEVYERETGWYDTRIRATWDAPDYPYVDHYRVELLDGSTLIQSGSPTSAEWVSPAVAEGVTYTVRVAVVTRVGASSDWVSDTLLAQGKHLPPQPVQWITATEFGGTVYANWGRGVDKDTLRYELRYGPVGGTWVAATVLDLIDGLSAQIKTIPAGTWTLYVDDLDSVLNYSGTPATTAVTVTLDVNAYLAAEYSHSAPTVAGMTEYRLGPTDAHRYWVTEDARPLHVKMPGTLDAYDATDLATYHDGSPSSWHGEAEDFGISGLSGTWRGTGDITVHAGAAGSYIEVSPDATTWDRGISDSMLATGRFARHVYDSDSGVFGVALAAAEPTGQGVRLDVIPRTYTGTGTSSASGATTITLDGPCAKFTELQITPIGATERTWAVDNLVPGDPASFDMSIFSGGIRIVSDFMWTAKVVG